MRFLFIDAKYPAFLAELYEDSPDLAMASYAEQSQRIAAGLFGEAHFQAAALVALGHEADVIVTNAAPAQRAWAREHDDPQAAPRWRRLLPRLGASHDGVNWAIVRAQIRAYRPDVLYVEIMDTIPASVAVEFTSMVRLSIAQIAAPVPMKAHRRFGLVLSSIPTMVDEFRALGIDSEWMPLAFEPAVLEQVPIRERDIAVSFVGSFAAGHPDRLRLIAEVGRVAPLKIWTGDAAVLGSLRPTGIIQGSAFGRRMYEVLARSRITINSHAIWAGPDANNLRLFEATGMGSLLVTDSRRNLGKLFDVGQQVVAYERPSQAAELIRFYLDRSGDASRIATAGQARTLREHTWVNRMAQVVTEVQSRI